MGHRKTGTKILKLFVQSPQTYRWLRPLIGLVSLRDDNIPYKVWVHFLLELNRQAYARRRPVIWMNSFAPVEIAYGLGAIPYMPEITAALVAYLGKSRDFIALADSHISTDVCSFYRCALGLALAGYLPRPDLIISSSHLCDGTNKFFHYVGQLYGCPHLMLDPPYSNGANARRYLIRQLEDLFSTTADILVIHQDGARLANALRLANQAHGYMAEINRLRLSRPSPLPGSEGLSYLAGMNFYSVGSPWGVRFFSSLYRYLREKVANREGYLPGERYRLLWLHHIRPYYPNEIFQTLTQHGVAVSFEEPNHLYWPPFDPSQPWESLADKILSNVWAGPLERRIQAIWEMVEDYHIDGVIHFSHWGCRQSCGGEAVIGDWLKDRGIPYIILPGDGADPDNYSPGQTRTRVEALVEMLR